MFFVHYPRDLREGVFVIVMRIPHCFCVFKFVFFTLFSVRDFAHFFVVLYVFLMGFLGH